jgi:hypothetical protein
LFLKGDYNMSKLTLNEVNEFLVTVHPVPMVYFDVYKFSNLCQMYSVQQLYKLTKHLWKSLKYAIHYQWDSTHYYISKDYDKTAITVLFSENEIGLWARDGLIGLTSFSDEYWTSKNFSKIFNTVNDLLDNLPDRVPCQKCRKFFLIGNMVKFSYAGIVCKKCFNPAIHRAPDTRGD